MFSWKSFISHWKRLHGNILKMHFKNAFKTVLLKHILELFWKSFNNCIKDIFKTFFAKHFIVLKMLYVDVFKTSLRKSFKLHWKHLHENISWWFIFKRFSWKSFITHWKHLYENIFKTSLKRFQNDYMIIFWGFSMDNFNFLK